LHATEAFWKLLQKVLLKKLLFVFSIANIAILFLQTIALLLQYILSVLPATPTWVYLLRNLRQHLTFVLFNAVKMHMNYSFSCVKMNRKTSGSQAPLDYLGLESLQKMSQQCY